jgi:hypothetical protein
MAGDAAPQVGQLGASIEAVQLGCDDQRVDRRRPLAARVRSREQPGFTSRWRCRAVCARARLRIERYSVGVPDFDGMVGGFKSLIDCLLPFHASRRPCGLGVIADDGPDVLVADYPPPFRARTRAEQRTVVTIEQLA